MGSVLFPFSRVGKLRSRDIAWHAQVTAIVLNQSLGS